MAIKDRIANTRISRKKTEKSKPDFGTPGEPINRSHPFYFGFVATLGGLSAIILMRALGSVSQVFVLMLVALFLATGLNPAVEKVRTLGLSRAGAVAVIFAGVLAFVIFFAWVLIPPVVTQGSALINRAPDLLQELLNNKTINSLNEQFGLIDTLQNKLKSITSNGTLLISAFGGVIGVGKTVVSGTFTALTILVLTLYFITSLPEMLNLGVRLAPASRRDRVSRLTHAIVGRVGSFVGAQVVIAFMAAIFVLVLALILGLPSPLAISVVVLVCALVPLIGHFLGSGVVTLIALTVSIPTGIIALISYIVYVQIENYFVTPRIMKRALEVPGAVTIIAALIGSSLLGLIGGLLAVPVAASIILILDEVVFPRSDAN